MELLFVTQFLPSPSAKGQTGGTISNRNLLTALAERWDVVVLSFDPATDMAVFASEPYRVIRAVPPRWRAPGLFLHWLDFVRTEVRQLIGEEGAPRLCLATTSTLAAFDAVPEECATAAIIQAYENFGFACPHVPLAKRVALAKQSVIRKNQDGRLLREADGILTNSEFMAQALHDRFGIDRSAMNIVPQACDVTPSAEAAPANTVGFVHRGPDKNIAFVVELAKRSPELTYLVYGHDGDLPAEIPPNMKLCGWASNREAMFASAKLWLAPSLWAEPFGRVSIEAQACDRAVLVVDRGGLPETVMDDRFKIDGFDAGRWLERMQALLALPRDELLANGKLIREAFSQQRHDASAIEAAAAIIEKSQETHFD
ncbi:hypothetical protein AMC99_02610 [Altererythrobacter epoxidivorans]|uniref:Glycosyltransferase subfamily 4-like N-terminal domain-containing protein n=1 Tax=Altererythrobacter epoxidivorans TaxID=361183 RepID=A0A0M4MVU3_9SPHN|nr:glycosyltransferase family 4 protein [Altererythrobacter epoxidivorans]ALE17883.1 hypothetical protein AMC99_02610 [Altererythrobacter epoxidivorans]